jgi:hypothetical protein
MTDISAIKTGERTIEIVHPATGEELGIRVSMVALEDERMKKLKRSILDRRLHLEARGKNFKAEEIDENRNALLFNAMTGWEWYEIKDEREQPKFKNKVPEFNRRDVYEVFDALPWFRNQIDEAVGDEKAFFGRSK